MLERHWLGCTSVDLPAFESNFGPGSQDSLVSASMDSRAGGALHRGSLSANLSRASTPTV